MTSYSRVGGGLAMVLVLGLGTIAAGTAHAQQGQQAPPNAGKLPLSRVVLFNSGVGFFEHNGKVEGDAKIEALKSVIDHVVHANPQLASPAKRMALSEAKTNSMYKQVSSHVPVFVRY